MEKIILKEKALIFYKNSKNITQEIIYFLIDNGYKLGDKSFNLSMTYLYANKQEVIKTSKQGNYKIVEIKTRR